MLSGYRAYCVGFTIYIYICKYSHTYIYVVLHHTKGEHGGVANTQTPTHTDTHKKAKENATSFNLKCTGDQHSGTSRERERESNDDGEGEKKERVGRSTRRAQNTAPYRRGSPVGCTGLLSYRKGEKQHSRDGQSSSPVGVLHATRGNC